MHYNSLRACLDDLEANGQLVRIAAEVDPYLEMAEIQRRAYAAGAPAILFERVKGSTFPAVCNLFGTMDRARFIFRHSLRAVERVVQLKADPGAALKAPWRFAGAPFTALRALPRPAWPVAPILYGQTKISQLPQLHSWPMDGGAYITLPQVFTRDPENPSLLRSNLGMYRIQLGGNDFVPDRELGLHYQIHRGIGVHHSAAARRGERLKVSIFVGGPPAHTFAAVMPLPEGLSELSFGGMLAGRAFRYVKRNGHLLSADADFCITGYIDPSATKPEGPFGDHLGYYSLQHPFPVMQVENVYHRKDAVWPFTVVGRPPQEDTTFGGLIHELTAAMVPVSVPGLKAMHAVDAAGVHPLLLAIGHERYVPYEKRQPRELLTVANAVLGFGQASLAKYLIIAATEDAPGLDIHDTEAFFQHILRRADWRRDLHFQTRTTIDTLDYSGTGLNEGSKVVIAAAGEPIRELTAAWPGETTLPGSFGTPRMVMPGVAVLKGPAFGDAKQAEADMEMLAEALKPYRAQLSGLPLIVVADDSAFAARSLSNWLWTCFTRSNPSHDIYGVDSFSEHKHWGCRGPLLIDARIKPHHAPPLVEDPAVSRRVDALAGPGGPLHGIL